MSAKQWRNASGMLTAVAVASCAQMPSMPKLVGMPRGSISPASRATPGDTAVARNGRPVVILAGAITDGRDAVPGRRIGDIRTTVFDISGTALVIDQDVPKLLSVALTDQLAADGFRLVSDPQAPHDIEIDGVAKNFRLDIVARDELNIDVNMIIRESGTHATLWAGTVTEQSSRFAGVSGNSRASITSFLNWGLNSWAIKASANVRENLLKAYPQSMTVDVINRNKSTSSLPGVVTTVTPVTPRESAATVPPPPPPPMTAVAAAPASPAAPAAAKAMVPSPDKGVFSVTTTPSGAKVFGDDVYYGTSPLRLELSPGVTVFHFELDGYRTITQKVSIRRGEVTDLDVKLRK